VPVTIHSVEVDGDVARLVVSHAPLPTVMAVEPGSGLRALEEGTLATFRVAGGALPYEISPAGLDADFDVFVAGTEGQIVGTPLNVGSVRLTFEIRDALGAVGTGTVTVDVQDADIGVEALLDALLGTGSTTGAAGYLDGQGNQNGRADVGDLRAYLRRTGQIG
jgi:hypothetical protein